MILLWQRECVRRIVLIDTWWNVNPAMWSLLLIGIVVLIDTWWNVNAKTEQSKQPVGKGFNRYMVECELFTKK